MDIAAFVVICGAAAVFGSWLSFRITGNRGMKADIPPAKRVRMVAAMAVFLGVGLFAAWSISNGHAAVGIGILVALYVVPNLVMIPLRIRESNRRARVARARRDGSRPHSSAP